MKEDNLTTTVHSTNAMTCLLMSQHGLEPTIKNDVDIDKIKHNEIIQRP